MKPAIGESPTSATCTARVVELAFLHMASHFTPSESTLTFFLTHFSASSEYGQTCISPPSHARFFPSLSSHASPVRPLSVVLSPSTLWTDAEPAETPSTLLIPSSTIASSSAVPSTPPLSSTPDGQALNLFAVEKLNYVVEDAQLMEMSAWALSTSIPRWLRVTADSTPLQRWMWQQLSLCVRCLDDCWGERLSGGQGDGLQPVGGWTFDEATFLRVYACIVLTTAVLYASRAVGMGVESGRRQREEVVERLRQIIALGDGGDEQRVGLHPVLRGCMERLLSMLQADAASPHAADCSSMFGCVSGLVLNTSPNARSNI